MNQFTALTMPYSACQQASQNMFDDAVRVERIFLRYEPKVVSSDNDNKCKTMMSSSGRETIISIFQNIKQKQQKQNNTRLNTSYTIYIVFILSATISYPSRNGPVYDFGSIK
jgi:multidrug efflux pump subunit AcrB